MELFDIILCFYFIFIKPMANLEDASSTMEQAGWKGNHYRRFFKRTFVDTGKTKAGSLGLVLVSEDL